MIAAPITVKVLADSINEGGDRLTTFEWTYPRMIHAEIMTHRALAKNSASSRAIPAWILRERTLAAPAYPGSWGANQKGMQAEGEVQNTLAAETWWLQGLKEAASLHAMGERLGLHKQVVNRVLEPWMMITIIISATEWANFFHLRNHKDAEPSFQKLAKLAWESYHENLPVVRPDGEWHLPLVSDEEREKYGDSWQMRQVSTGRCARVSYLTHDGRRDMVEDIALHDRLLGAAESGGPMHLSPFEHPCMAITPGKRIGPFTGWQQYRKMFAGEAGPPVMFKCNRCGCWGGRHVKSCPQNIDPAVCNSLRSCGLRADTSYCDCPRTDGQ